MIETRCADMVSHQDGSTGDLLVMEGIRKGFPGVQALDNVSLHVKAGEVHVILGENGAGKSTLMKILSGAYQADSGRIVFAGKPVHIETPQQALELGISMVYQEFNLAPHLSVRENIWLGREPLRSTYGGIVDWREMDRRTREILQRLHLTNVSPTTRVDSLSVAQQQMVEIAKALSVHARLIVMDEPTATLTEHEIARLFAVIRELKASGVSIIYISHRLEEIPQIGDRITVLRDGRTVAVVPADTAPDELIRLMVGRNMEELFPKVEVKRGEEALRVEHLNRLGVLHDIHLQAFQGEILGIAGLVGSGRSELARAIFGADPIDSGKVYVMGKEVKIDSPAKAIESGIAYLSEDRKLDGLALSMSITENVTMASLKDFQRWVLVDRDRERRKTQELMDSLEIKAPGPYQKAGNLSGGNQQKVVLAKWLCTRARIFIFDEPTRGIDVGAKVEIYRLMNDLAREGACVLMISSYLPEILAMSDRIVVMREGRISGELLRSEASEERVLKLATVG